ncbi:hypothetical protein Hdeb2414_s0003g00113191 [Helianthus debilis subsp. tardiflorus]
MTFADCCFKAHTHIFIQETSNVVMLYVTHSHYWQGQPNGLLRLGKGLGPFYLYI